MSAIKVFVPRDSAALAVGADEVAAVLSAQAAQRGLAVELVRNSSRGLFWLETLIEVQTPQGRVAYGPVAPEDVAGLLDPQTKALSQQSYESGVSTAARLDKAQWNLPTPAPGWTIRSPRSSPARGPTSPTRAPMKSQRTATSPMPT